MPSVAHRFADYFIEQHERSGESKEEVWKDIQTFFEHAKVERKMVRWTGLAPIPSDSQSEMLLVTSRT